MYYVVYYLDDAKKKVIVGTYKNAKQARNAATKLFYELASQGRTGCCGSTYGPLSFREVEEFVRSA